MTDPLSVTVSAFSLADIAFRSGCAIANFISTVLEASAALGPLRKKIKETNETIALVRALCLTYRDSTLVYGARKAFETLVECLDHYIKDVARLGNVIGYSDEASDKWPEPFTVKLKFACKKGEIAELSQCLEAHKSSLANALEIIGRHNDLALYNNLNQIQSTIEELQTQSASHAKDFLQMASTQATVAHGHRGELVKNISESRVAMTASFTNIEARFDHLNEIQAKLLTKAEERDSRIDLRLCRIEREVAALLRQNELHDCETNVCYDRETIFKDSAKAAATSLGSFEPHIRLILSNTRPGPLFIPTNDARWLLQSEYSRALTDAWRKALQEPVAGSLKRTFSGTSCCSSTRYPLWSRRLMVSCTYMPGTPLALSFRKPTAVVSMTTSELSCSAGKLFILFGKESTEDAEIPPRDTITRARLVFIPRAFSLLASVVVKLISCFRDHTKLHRTISTFGVQPDGSEVFSHIRSGNVNGLRTMLAAGAISVNDRDQRGNSLLWHVLVRNYNFEMSTLLLQQGADASDCNRHGDSALATFLSNLPKDRTRNRSLNKDILDSIRLLIRYCGIDAHCILEYKQSGGVKCAPTGLLHCLLSRRNHKVQILEPLSLILQQEDVNREDSDIHGMTPLLRAVHYTPRWNLVTVTRALLQNRVKISAVNVNGESALHLLLRRISACNDYRMGKVAEKKIVDLLVTLLEHFRDPTLGNVLGYTPFDAALSPTAWVLWCEALERAGFDIEIELQKLDVRNGVVHSKADLEARYEKVTKRTPPTIPSPIKQETFKGRNTPQRPCHLCGRDADSGQTKRRMPFDEFYSDILDEVGLSTHMKLSRHIDGSPCTYARLEASCLHLDYSPNHMKGYLKERSWRKHVAYRLWRDRVFSSPSECHKWASEL